MDGYSAFLAKWARCQVSLSRRLGHSECLPFLVCKLKSPTDHTLGGCVALTCNLLPFVTLPALFPFQCTIQLGQFSITHVPRCPNHSPHCGDNGSLTLVEYLVGVPYQLSLPNPHRPKWLLLLFPFYIQGN